MAKSKLCSSTSTVSWYCWIVLSTACLSQMFSFGYMHGTISLLSLYYEDRYNERKISAAVGATQLSVAYLFALPCAYAREKIGTRWLQVLSSLMFSAGIGITAFTTEAWQALLSTGILGGIGVAGIITATYSIVSQHFPGTQIAPYAALTFCYNAGSMLTPIIVSNVMAHLKYTKTLLLICGIASVNIICGFFFISNDTETGSAEARESTSSSKLSLKLPGRRKGIYCLPHEEMNRVQETGKYRKLGQDKISKSTKEIASSELKGIRENDSSNNSFSNEIPLSKGKMASENSVETSMNFMSQPFRSKDVLTGTSLPVLKFEKPKSNDTGSWKILMRNNSKLSSILSNLHEDESSATCNEETFPVDQKKVKSYILGLYGHDVAELIADPKLACDGIKTLIQKPAAQAYILCCFFGTAGSAGFSAICGDYSRYQLRLNDDQYSLGMTFQGIAMLAGGLTYLVLVRYVEICATLFHCVLLASYGLNIFAGLYPLTSVQFYIWIGCFGLIKAMYGSNLFTCCMEITSPSQAVLMYTIELLAEGIGGIFSPYLLGYLQVDVNMKAGMITAACFYLVAAVIISPFTLKYLIKPKVYLKHDYVKNKVVQVSHNPIEEYYY